MVNLNCFCEQPVLLSQKEEEQNLEEWMLTFKGPFYAAIK
jgi:hypothetical protein